MASLAGAVLSWFLHHLNLCMQLVKWDYEWVNLIVTNIQNSSQFERSVTEKTVCTKKIGNPGRVNKRLRTGILLQYKQIKKFLLLCVEF